MTRNNGAYDGMGAAMYGGLRMGPDGTLTQVDPRQMFRRDAAVLRLDILYFVEFVGEKNPYKSYNLLQKLAAEDYGIQHICMMRGL